MATEDEIPAVEASKGGMLRMLIVGAVFLGVGAGGATFLLPSLSAKPTEVAATDDATPKDEAGKPKPEKKKKAKKAKGKAKGSSTILDLNPMVVSLYREDMKASAVPRLRLSVSVDTGDGGIGDGTRQRLRHAFIGALQALDAKALRGPEGLEHLTQALRKAANEALDIEVADVFITEFIIL